MVFKVSFVDFIKSFLYKIHFSEKKYTRKVHKAYRGSIVVMTCDNTILKYAQKDCFTFTININSDCQIDSNVDKDV